MRTLALTGAVTLAAFGLAAASEPSPAPTPESYVATLTEADFQSAIHSDIPLLVEFTAGWCGACRTWKPEVERAARIVRERQLGFNVARIDAPSAMDVSEEYGVTSLPAFILFRDGAPIKFPSLHTAEAMIAGVNKLLDLGLTVSPVKNFDGSSSEELLQWLFWRGTGEMKFHTTMVLYEPPGVSDAALGDARQLRAAFEGAADDLLRFSNLRFGSVSSAAIVEELELPADRSTLVVYYDHDDGRAVYSGPPEAALIREWVLRHDVPLVTTIWHRNLQQTRKRVETVGLFFVSGRQADDAPTVTRVKAALQEVVLALVQSGRIVRGDFTLGVVDGGKYKSWLSEYGLPEGDLPALALENTTSGQLYVGPATIASLGSAGAPDEWVAAQAAKRSADEAEWAADKVEREAAGEPAPYPLPPALTWVTVPKEQVAATLSAYLGGSLAPVKTLDKPAGATATPTPLAPVGPDAATPTPVKIRKAHKAGHDDEEL